MDVQHFLAYGLAGLVLYYATAPLFSTSDLDHIPAVGPSGLLVSYLGALKYLFNAREMTVEGYRKYPNGVFRIANLQMWLIFCCGRSYIEDIRKAKDDELSLFRALEEPLQMMGSELTDDSYHLTVIHPTLTRSLPAFYPDIHDEVVQSFKEYIFAVDNEWTAVSVMKVAPKIIGRTVNRLFVGLPACRAPDYLDVSVEFAFDVLKIGALIRCFPKFMRPLVGRHISRLPTQVKRVTKHIGPILDGYLNREKYAENPPPEPTEFMKWLWKGAPDERRNPRDFIRCLLAVNFGAISTSSMTFTHALYHLAANPAWATMLREEVEKAIGVEGWTKAALDRMVKLDSFLKESQRMNGLSVSTLMRKALKDFKLSDGTVIPAGATIAVPTWAMHYDESLYPNADVFDPLRFVKQDGQEGANDGDTKPASAARSMNVPTVDYLAWGYGKHACPGRFLAATVLKTMLAHILMSYDVRFEKEGVRPANCWIDSYCLPNISAEVLFRRRNGE